MKERVLGKLVLCSVAALLTAAADGRRMVAAEPPKPAGAELRYEEPTYLTGAIYVQGSARKELLFKFKREARRSGDKLNVQREFTYPDGKLASREQVAYEGDALVLYNLEDLQTGASGSASIEHAPENPAKGRIEFEYSQESGARRKTRTEALTENALSNDMVGPFLVAHWDSLLRGDKVKCRYLVVPRRETVGFTFLKDSESTWKGSSVLIVKMEVSSRLLAALVDPLFFTIEKAPPHRVFQYVGRTTPKIRVGHKWKDLDAVTVLDWETAR